MVCTGTDADTDLALAPSIHKDMLRLADVVARYMFDAIKSKLSVPIIFQTQRATALWHSLWYAVDRQKKIDILIEGS